MTRFVALCLLLLPPGRVSGQIEIVEEFVLAIDPRGNNGLGEEARIAGGRVVWKRRGEDGSPLGDRLECRSLHFAEGSPSGLVAHAFGLGGVVLTPHYLFGGSGFREDIILLTAGRLGEGCSPPKSRQLVEDQGDDLFLMLAGNRDYAFFRHVYMDEFNEIRYRLLAVCLDDLDAPGWPAFIEITPQNRPANKARAHVASDRYFVWQDRRGFERYWQIYVIDLRNGLPSEPVRVIDSKVSSLGSYLALHDSKLVFQGATKRGRPLEHPYGLFFVDLDDLDAEPEPIVLVEEVSEVRRSLTWPTISDEFFFWTEQIDFFRREGWAMRMVDGRPSGEAVYLGAGVSRPSIDRNLVVFEGVAPDELGIYRKAIKVWELDLPGADDVGDADADGNLNITDAVVILRYLFQGGQRPRLRLADTNLDRRITLGDAIDVLHTLFSPRP